MTLESRHLCGSLLVAAALHAALVAWVGQRTASAPPPHAGYSLMRVRLGVPQPPASAAPAAPPRAEALPPRPQPVVEPPPAPPQPAPRPPVRKVVSEPRVAPQPKPRVDPPPPPPLPQDPVEAAPPDSAPASLPAAPVDGPVGRPEGAVQGASTGGTTDTNADPAGDPELPPAYIGQVRSWLERHRTYPLAARRQRIEGRAVLWFRIDRQGKVLAYRIVEGSGHGLLDRAVEQMIERASPLPRVPRDHPVDEPEFLIPIDFRLR